MMVWVRVRILVRLMVTSRISVTVTVRFSKVLELGHVFFSGLGLVRVMGVGFGVGKRLC